MFSPDGLLISLSVVSSNCNSCKGRSRSRSFHGMLNIMTRMRGEIVSWCSYIVRTLSWIKCTHVLGDPSAIGSFSPSLQIIHISVSRVRDDAINFDAHFRYRSYIKYLSINRLQTKKLLSCQVISHKKDSYYIIIYLMDTAWSESTRMPPIHTFEKEI